MSHEIPPFDTVPPWHGINRKPFDEAIDRLRREALNEARVEPYTVDLTTMQHYVDGKPVDPQTNALLNASLNGERRVCQNTVKLALAPSKRAAGRAPKRWKKGGRRP